MKEKSLVYVLYMTRSKMIFSFNTTVMYTFLYVFGLGGMWSGYHMTPYGGSGMWSGIGVFIVWILVISIIVFVVVRLSEHTGDIKKMREDTSDRPLDILKERYVRGEIDREEFEQKKKDIQ